MYTYMYMYICLFITGCYKLAYNQSNCRYEHISSISLVQYELLPTHLTEAPPCMRLLGYPIFSALIFGFWEVNRTIGQEPF